MLEMVIRKLPFLVLHSLMTNPCNQLFVTSWYMFGLLVLLFKLDKLLIPCINSDIS
jgi:hypothetical protein